MSRPRPTQRGSNIIELMVGLALSLLTAVAMLGAYRTMVGVSVPATRTAKREGQAAAALLTAQIEAQQAGYGIESTLAGPTVHLPTTKKIVWRFRETVGGNIKCAGLLIQASTPSVGTDGIYFLQPADCTRADDSITFDPRLLATESVLFEPPTADSATSIGEARSYNLSTAEFQLSNAPSCGPYGVTGTKPSSKLLQLKDTRGDSNPANDVVVFSNCLSNL